MDPKWLVVKVLVRKGCTNRWDVVIERIGVVSHHLRSLLGAIGLIVLCAFVCRVEYFDARIRESILYE